jgi:hypothetical protein
MPPAIRPGTVSVAGMDCGVSPTEFPNPKRKAAEAALDEGLSDGEDAAAVVAVAPADQLLAAPPQQQGQGTAATEASGRPKAIRKMSQEWIDSANGSLAS